MAEDQQWVVPASRESHTCVNPVRSCEELYFTDVLEKRDKSKELIKLSIGKQPPPPLPLPPPKYPSPSTFKHSKQNGEMMIHSAMNTTANVMGEGTLKILIRQCSFNNMIAMLVR